MITNKRHLFLGLIALALVAVFTVFVGLALTGGPSGSSFAVSATFERRGQLLKVGSDVKFRGILVGSISDITLTEGRKARLTFDIDPKQKIPDNVSAAIRGKTLFGEKFVQLSVDDPSSTFLEAGDEILETVDPFELETVLETGLPVLNAIEPERFGKLLHALAEGVAGQEEAGKRTIDNSLTALQAINSRTGDFDRLLGGLDDSSAALASSVPNVVAAFGNIDSFNKVVLSNSFAASGALRDVPKWTDSLAEIMESRLIDLIDLSVKGADVLDVVDQRRLILPSTVENLKLFTQAWVTNMSVGCTAPDGTTIGDVFPTLSDSTCWQIWQLSGEPPPKTPGGYGAADRPTPDATTASLAFRSQVEQLQGLSFGETADDLSILLYTPLKDDRGLIPEGLL